MANYTGTPGNYTATGTTGDDTFDLTQFGNDTVSGSDGDDIFNFGGAFDSSDSVDGGAGTDTLSLAGSYDLTITGSMLTNVERLVASNVPANQSASFTIASSVTGLTTVDASALASTAYFSVDARNAANALTIIANASDNYFFASTHGDTITGGGGDDDVLFGGSSADYIVSAPSNRTYTVTDKYTGAVTTLNNIESIVFQGDNKVETILGVDNIGTAGNDTLGAGGDDLPSLFDMSQGGNDVASGGNGDDVFYFGGTFNAGDRVTGNGGTDTLELTGDYAGANALTITSNMLLYVEDITLGAGFNYDLTVNSDVPVTRVDASALGVGDTLNLTVSPIHNAMAVTGGAGNDTFRFVRGFANLYNDMVDGGGGNNTLVLDNQNGLVYLEITAGMLANIQQITLLNGEDHIVLDAAPSGVRTIDASALVGALDLDARNYSNALVVTGGANNDAIDATAFGDTINGGIGDDTVNFAGNRSDYTVSTPSNRTFMVTNKSSNAVTTLTDVENVGFLGDGVTQLVLGDYDVGTAGNDFFQGNDLPGTFDLSQGGSDTATGGAGDDTFYLGGAFDASDSIIGYGGIDSLILSGDYSAGVIMGEFTLVAVEKIYIDWDADTVYRLTTNDATVQSGQSLTVAGISTSPPASTATLIFNGAAETNGVFNIAGAPGGNTLTGGTGADIFDLSYANTGTTNVISGGGGNDTIRFAGTFNANDQIDGGSGVNSLYLSGDYSAGVTFGANTIKSIQFLYLNWAAPGIYNLTTNDANVAGGAELQIGAYNVGSPGAVALHFDGSAETDGYFAILGTPGSDVLIGGAGNDIFQLYSSSNPGATGNGNDSIVGGGGDDAINFGASFGSGDHVDGGTGYDTLDLNGDYSNPLTITGAMLSNVEQITVEAGHNYNLKLNADVSVAGAVTVNGSALGAGDSLDFDGSSLANAFVVTGGAGNDVLTGGAGSDYLQGGGGNDTLNGGPGGADVAVYSGSAAQYQITALNDHGYQVSDLRAGAPDGADILTGIGTLQFADQNVTLAAHDIAPVVNTGNISASPGAVLSLSGLLSVTDADGDVITQYQLLDTTSDPASGYFAIDGVQQAAGAAITISAVDLAQTSFVTGSVADSLQIRASDGQAWSAGDSDAWAPFTVSPIVGQPNGNNGTDWVNSYDTANAWGWSWKTDSYDASQQLTTEVRTNDDGSHSLTLYDASNQYSWASATISYDANWNQTGLTGTNDDGSHNLATSGIAAALDTTLWFATPYNPSLFLNTH